jgi:hypothetical protein
LFHALETSLSWMWINFRIDSAHLSLKSNEQCRKLLKCRERDVGRSGELRFITWFSCSSRGNLVFLGRKICEDLRYFPELFCYPYLTSAVSFHSLILFDPRPFHTRLIMLPKGVEVNNGSECFQNYSKLDITHVL